MVYKKFSTMTVVYCLKMVVAISWVQIIFEQKKTIKHAYLDLMYDDDKISCINRRKNGTIDKQRISLM